MTKEIKSIYQNNGSMNSINYYQDMQNEKPSTNYIVREEFKKSISNWKLQRKIERLVKGLEK